MDEKAKEVNDAANNKLLEMSKMVETMKELNAQRNYLILPQPANVPNTGARPKIPRQNLPPGPPQGILNQSPGPNHQVFGAAASQQITHAQILQKKSENKRLENTPKANKVNTVKYQKVKNKFVNKLHERQEAFKAALQWVGVFMTREEIIAWIGDPQKHQWTDRKILKC